MPSLALPFVDGASVTFDGTLDEPVWKQAADTGAFVDVGRGGPASGPIRGSALLFWDDVGLYAAYRVEDATLRGGFASGSIDPHLWERDTVELMLDPDGDGDARDYYELQVSPQNLVFDSQFDSENQPRGGPSGPFGHQEWSSHVTSGVALDGTLDDDSDRDRGYTVELRVPWSALDKARRAPPASGDAWRINLYAMQDNGGVAWSPILGQGNFHHAMRFGRVTFTR